MAFTLTDWCSLRFLIAKSGRRRAAEILARVSGDAHFYTSGTNSGANNCRANVFASVGRFSPWGPRGIMASR